MLKGTPLHARTSALCQAQNWRRWAGYLAASSYELGHEREYHSIRSAAGLIDISPLFKYLIRGRGAIALLNRVVTRDVSRCAVNQVMYTPWCDEAGKVIDDGTLSRLDETTFRLTAADPTLMWLQDNSTGLDVTIDDVSATTAALALQGPAARDILKQSTDADLDSLEFFHLTPAVVRDIPVTISRTGYTGDLGYEIWIPAEHAGLVWDALMETGDSYGITPAGMLALDIARIEAGLLLIDVDYVSAHRAMIEGQKSSPYELGLGWTVKLKSNGFVGHQALLAENNRTPKWQLRGLDVHWESLEELYDEVGLPVQLPTTAWRTSVPVYSDGKQIGYATSGCWSPILKQYIALAHIEALHADVGREVRMEITVEHRRKQAVATIVETPFFNPPRKRA